MRPAKVYTVNSPWGSIFGTVKDIVSVYNSKSEENQFTTRLTEQTLRVRHTAIVVALMLFLKKR